MHEKRQDIQGLRAIAVLAVVAFHADKLLLPGGFVGVDVFFVLSGYLITGILLRPMEAGQFSIIDFYRRRVRRLFPALFTMMAFCLGAGLLIFPPTLLIEQVESQFFTTLFLSNFYFEDNTDYFDLQVELMPLLHTWSLGVEEQFYLLFPPILYGLHRFAKKALMPTLFVFALISLYYSQAGLAEHAKESFYFPTSRAFELLIGSLCVGLEKRVVLPALASRIVSVVALIALGSSFFIITAMSPFPGVMALLPCLATAALLLTREGWGNQVISNKPLVYIGDISYSLYLWHWPLLVFAGVLYPNSALAVSVALILSFGLSAVSYKYIETPFLRQTPKRLFLKAGGVMAVSLGLALTIYFNEGLPQRFSSEARQLLAASNDYNQDRPRCHMRSSEPRPYDEMCIYGDQSVAAEYIVWGDSHGAEVAKVLGNRLGPIGRSVRHITMSGCPATLSRRQTCTDNNIEKLAAIKQDPAVHTILLTSNLHGDDKFAWDAVKGVEQTALELKKAGKRPIIVYPLPTFDFDPPSQLALEVRAGRDPANVGMERALYDKRSGKIVSEFNRFTRENNIAGAPTTDVFCDEQRCYAYRAEVGVLYYNQGHISMTGAGLLVDYIINNNKLLEKPAGYK